MSGSSMDRPFSFKCGLSGASVTCLRCGVIVAKGRWPRDVYPKADTHVCEIPQPSRESRGGTAAPGVDRCKGEAAPSQPRILRPRGMGYVGDPIICPKRGCESPCANYGPGCP